LKTRLRTKMIAFTLVLVLVIMITVTYFFTIREINVKRSSLSNQIEKLAQNIATLQLVDQQEWNTYQEYINQLMDTNEDIVYIAVYDERNSLRAYTLNRDLIETDYPVISPRIEARIVERLDQGLVAEESENDMESARVNIMVNDKIIGSVHVGYSLININNELRNGILLNLILAVIFTIIFSFAAFLVSRRLAYPLEQLNTAMQHVIQGDLSKELETHTHDEIADLIQVYNEMIKIMRERKIIESMGQELSSTFRLEELTSLLSKYLKSAINAQSVHLYINNQDKIERIGQNLLMENKNISGTVALSNPDLQKYLFEHHNGFMINEAPSFIRTLLKPENSEKNVLIIPVILNEKLVGILLFTLPENKDNYTAKEIEFARTLSVPAGLALENAILYGELREQERIKRELEIAREVQMRLLPKSMPEINGFDINAICIPANEVGGDYYDFFNLPGNKLGIVIADVSGKGTSASFYMAQLKGMMIQLAPEHNSPVSLLFELNQKLYSSLEKNMFITLIYGILDIQTQKLQISRAGHNSFIHIKRDKSYHIYTPSGIGLGLDRGEIFKSKLEQINITLKPDDSLLFYTDGITEAMNEKDEEFGEDRLLHAALESKSSGASRKSKTIQDQMNKFVGNNTPHDDITLIIVDCNAKK
jgi:serine phosphatase RsbU (regulator of sigma subunit)/HAMP domain-containing protein